MLLPGLCPGINQLQQVTSTVCIHLVQGILGAWYLFSAYFCNITVLHETLFIAQLF